MKLLAAILARVPGSQSKMIQNEGGWGHTHISGRVFFSSGFDALREDLRQRLAARLGLLDEHHPEGRLVLGEAAAPLARRARGAIEALVGRSASSRVSTRVRVLPPCAFGANWMVFIGDFKVLKLNFTIP